METYVPYIAALAMFWWVFIVAFQRIDAASKPMAIARRWMVGRYSHIGIVDEVNISHFHRGNYLGRWADPEVHRPLLLKVTASEGRRLVLVLMVHHKGRWRIKSFTPNIFKAIESEKS